MEMLQEDRSTTRPLILNGRNYSYWKTRMTSFIKSIDVKAWKVVSGWDLPMITDDGKATPKPVDW